MGFLDRLFGRNQPREEASQPAYQSQPQDQPLTDEQAIERYKYMLRTAPPEAIEQAHEEAFAKLTPEQRQMVLDQLSTVTPENERSTTSQDPRALARMATRAEVRQPGTLVNIFGKPITKPGDASDSSSTPSNAAPGYGNYGGYPPYGGYGGMMGGFGGSLLSSIAGAFIGTAIADSLFNNFAYDQGYADGMDQNVGNGQPSDGDSNADANDQGSGDADTQTMDYGSGDTDYADQQDWGGDPGGDYGGSDFGGGDFGGDFGGGDF